ncbi:hypothetical protein SAMN02745127_00606 [Oceanospirillum multiglobuliferum]|nr:hypothetical protein SAMN02745127_00606 [Oceanospirillum multiglobuliferum]
MIKFDIRDYCCNEIVSIYFGHKKGQHLLALLLIKLTQND